MVDTHHHLFITGTGRAGTSFLVRYLDALGLDTVLSQEGEGKGWDEDANAGLEQSPAQDVTDRHNAYVLKSPLLHEYIDEMLNRPSVTLDAVVIPVRDLMEASSSRLILERRAMYQHHPWIAEMDSPWETWAGGTPGGALYSLNILDQARIMSAAFYTVVERLIAKDIPIIFLHFPRFIEDPDYLFQKLKCRLPSSVTVDEARKAHRQLANTKMVRVRKNVPESTPHFSQIDVSDPGFHAPNTAHLDLIAARREIIRLRKLLHESDLTSNSRLGRIIKAIHRVRRRIHSGATSEPATSFDAP